MFRVFLALLCNVAFAEIAREGANPPPYDLISVAMESETGDPAEARRAAEEARFESQTLGRIAERKAKADRALASLLAAENSHAETMFNSIGIKI